MRQSIQLPTETAESENSDAAAFVDPLHPPQGLECQYQTIFNLLSGCIVEKSNPVAFLMGPRGCGKHFVLETCLQSLQKKISVDSSIKKPIFRTVRLSGLLLQGDDAAAGREIIRQLSSFSTTSPEVIPPTAATSSAYDGTVQPISIGSKKRQRDGSFSSVASFHSYVTLLDEMLHRSRIDGIPILIIISDVEAFASGSSARVEKQALATAAVSGRLKQILLYHLLDMASSEKTYMGIFAITTRLNFFDMLEKRIRSRAFGAQAVVQFTKCRDRNNSFTDAARSSSLTNMPSPTLSSEYQDLILILTQHLSRYYLQQEAGKNRILGSLKSILLNYKGPIYALFSRQLSLGKSITWFLRVLLVSYSIMMGSYRLHVDSQNATEDDSTPIFTQQHLLDGLVTMGCDVTEAYKQGVQSALLNGVAGLKPSNISCTNESQPSNCSAEISKAILLKASNNHRMQQLYDASSSQLVLLFSARRLLVKDFLSTSSSLGVDSTNTDKAQEVEVDYARPLTFKRMYKEYYDKFVKVYSSSSYRTTCGGKSKGSGGATFSSLIFPQPVLLRSFLQLLECDVFRPSADHTGGGLVSYDFAKRYSPLALADEGEITSIPVHITIEIEEELTVSLQQSEELLECISVLKEWGMKCIT